MENRRRIAAVEPVKGLFHRMRADLDRRVAGAVRILADDLWDGFFLCLIVKEAS